MPLAAIALGVDDGDCRHDRESVEHRSRPIARSVVDDDDFPGGGKLDLDQPCDDGGDRRLFVEDGDDDRDERRRDVVRDGQSWMEGLASQS